MPVDLPVRKVLEAHTFLADASDPLMLAVAALCFMIALSGLITHTPRSYRDRLTAAVYEDMLRGP